MRCILLIPESVTGAGTEGTFKKCRFVGDEDGNE